MSTTAWVVIAVIVLFLIGLVQWFTNEPKEAAKGCGGGCGCLGLIWICLSFYLSSSSYNLQNPSANYAKVYRAMMCRCLAEALDTRTLTTLFDEDKKELKKKMVGRLRVESASAAGSVFFNEVLTQNKIEEYLRKSGEEGEDLASSAQTFFDIRSLDLETSDVKETQELFGRVKEKVDPLFKDLVNDVRESHLTPQEIQKICSKPIVDVLLDR